VVRDTAICGSETLAMAGVLKACSRTRTRTRTKGQLSGRDHVIVRSFSGKLRVAEAGYEVVVDHANGLHVGVADGGAHKFKTALEQVLA